MELAIDPDRSLRDLAPSRADWLTWAPASAKISASRYCLKGRKPEFPPERQPPAGDIREVRRGRLRITHPLRAHHDASLEGQIENAPLVLVIREALPQTLRT
jgi:hypothetical protein